MNQNLRILVVDPLKGEPSVQLIDDAASADKAFEKSSHDPANECVRLFIYPGPQRVRYPANDAVMIAENKKRAEQAAKDRENAALKKAEAAREKAREEFEKADKAHKSLLPADTAPKKKADAK